MSAPSSFLSFTQLGVEAMAARLNTAVPTASTSTLKTVVPTAGTRDMSSPPQDHTPTQAQTMDATRKQQTFWMTTLSPTFMLNRPMAIGTHASAVAMSPMDSRTRYRRCSR